MSAASQLESKTRLVADLETTVKELEFYERETTGERNLLASLNELLAKAKDAPDKMLDAESEEERDALVRQFKEATQEVEWEIAEGTLVALKQDLEARAENPRKFRKRAEELERLFTEAKAVFEAAYRDIGVRLTSENRYVQGVLEAVTRVKQAHDSKLYKNMPKLMEEAEQLVSNATTLLGAPLSASEHLKPALDHLREKIRKVQPFTARADLLLLLSRTEDCVEYTVLLRTPSQPGTTGINIQGSSTLVEQDRIELGQKVTQIGDAIRSGAVRGMSAEPADETVAPAPVSAEALLGDLGQRLYRLVMPEDMQRYLQENPCSVIVTTNDLELPWELMRFQENFLCLEQPVARMPMGYTIPRRVGRRTRSRDERRFLLIWSNPRGDLAAAQKEIEAIDSALKKEKGLRTDVVGNITGGELNDLLLRGGEYDVVHYAGHAQFDRKRPEQSALVVRRGDQKDGEGRYLTVRFFAQKIRRLMEGQPLVFLNACETGSTAPEQQTEFTLRSPAEGLASAFVYGGALGCIGSLWPVSDVYAAEFAIDFYKRLLNDETIGESLRESRREIRKRHADSATWATFVLYGDPTFRLDPNFRPW